MLIDWTDEFERWLDRVEEQGGDRSATVVAMLQRLQELNHEPNDESATFKRVRQARRHRLWRVAHPYHPDFACRLIVWFPHDGRAVIVVVGGDKARMGDEFYDSGVARGEAAIDQWLRQNGRPR